MNKPARQTGVALISMLLIFSLVVIIVSGAVSRMGNDIRTTGYHLLHSQAYQYALGGEALARQILHDDWRNDQELGQGDHPLEAWYQDRQFQPDGGLMRIRIRDLNSRYNLNNLMGSNGQADANQVRLFQRLAYQLGLNQEQVAACLDWLDPDTQPRTASSEDVYFLSQDPGYRSSDGPMSSVTELNALQQFDWEQLERLQDEVVALPTGTTINPNTASERLLNSLSPDLDGAQVIAAREQLPQGFVSASAFLQHEVTAGIDLSSVKLDVHSEYFQVWVAAGYQEHTTYLTSVLYRNPSSGVITVLNRSQLRPVGVFSSTDNNAQSKSDIL